MSTKLIEVLWVEFMRKDFCGHPLWCWFADRLDKREKEAFRAAFMGMEPFIQASIRYQAAIHYGESVGSAAHCADPEPQGHTGGHSGDGSPAGDKP